MYINCVRKILVLISVFAIIFLLSSCKTSKGNVNGLSVSKESHMGNLMGNIQNYGYAVQDDRYAYYVSFESADINGKQCINRVDFDGLNKTFVCQANAMFLNVINGWIYYINMGDGSTIYRVDVNGQNNQRISDISATSLIAYKDTLYAIGTHDKYRNNIYVMDTNGGNVKMLSDEQVVKIYLYNDIIYFVEYAPKDINTHIGKMELNGDNKENVFNFAGSMGWFSIYDDTIYFTNQTNPDTLYKVSVLGQNQAKIADIKDLISNTININKNVLYYSTLAGSVFGERLIFHQLDLETGNEFKRSIRVMNPSNGKYISIFDSLIDNKIFRMENGKMFIMDSDGKDSKPLN